MQARAAEVRTSGRSKDKASAEAQACLDAIAAMPRGTGSWPRGCTSS